MRKKIVKTAPLPNAPGTSIIYYADGSKGYRYGDASQGDTVSIPHQGWQGKSREWGGEATDGDPASDTEIEEILSTIRKDPDSLNQNEITGSLPLKKGGS